MSFILEIILVLALPVLAENKGVGNLNLDFALGSPASTITNPDSTKANYKGLSTTVRFQIPLYGGKHGGLLLNGNIKYLDLENAAQSSEKEFSQHIGPGLGFELRASRLFLGYEYYLMKARHVSTGPLSHSLEYNYPSTQLYYGIAFQAGQLSIGFSQSQATGEVPSSSTGLQSNSPYSDTITWFNIRYDVGVSAGKFTSGLINY